MVADEDQITRELALRRILKARNESALEQQIPRSFEVPSINFLALKYQDLLYWSITEVTDPPLLKNVSTEVIQEMISNKDFKLCLDDIEAIPCHTQAVERANKYVTEASASVYGEKRRGDFIRTRRFARSQQHSFDSKKDYNV